MIQRPSPEIKKKLDTAITEQLNHHIQANASMPHVKAAKSMMMLHYKSWRIIDVETGITDDAFLFYSDDPLSHHFLNVWGGSAPLDEENSIKSWAVKDIPGIPDKLAACFGWYVVSED